MDTNQRTIYPGGDVKQSDTCGLVGRRGAEEVGYDLRVRLDISIPECEGGPDEAACQHVDPLEFHCGRARGSNTDVPASDTDVVLTVRVSVHPLDGGSDFIPPEDCIAVPGPRLRPIPAGLVTDLAVYQLVVNALDYGDPNPQGQQLDLDGCDPNFEDGLP